MGFFKRLFTLGRDEEYDTAMSFYNSHRYHEAVTLFEKILSRKRSSQSLYHNLAQFYCGQAHRNLGIMLFATGNFSAALDEFQRSRRFNEQHVDVHHFIGICQNNLGHFEDAVDTFSTVLKIDPSHVPTKLKLGIALHNLKMWDKAVNIYSCILEKNPRYADVHYRLGLALTGQGQTQAAVDEYQKAVAINPNYIEAKKKLGVTQAYLGQFDDARGNLAAILEKNPDYADIHYYLGIVYAGQGDIEKALATFDQALAINPNYRDACIKKGILLCRQRDYAQGLEVLQRAADLEPDDSSFELAITAIKNNIEAPEKDHEEVETILGRIFGGSTPLAQTIQEFNRHIEISPDVSAILPIIKHFSEDDNSLCEMLVPFVQDYIKQFPNYPDLHNTLGTLFIKLKRIDEAVTSLNEAVRINPDYLDARINLFKALNECRSYGRAREHGEYIIAQNVPYPDVYSTMAEVSLGLGEDDEALRHARKAIELNSRYAQAHYVLGCVYARQGNSAEARAAFEKCTVLHPARELNQKAKEAIGRLD